MQEVPIYYSPIVAVLLLHPNEASTASDVGASIYGWDSMAAWVKGSLAA